MKKRLEEIYQIVFRYINVDLLRANNTILIYDREVKHINFNSPFIKYEHSKDYDAFKEKVKNFINTMYEKCENFDSKIFEKNFEITIVNLQRKDVEVTGKIRSGTINKLTINDLSATEHELIHLSTIDERPMDNKFMPFYEGYTELITKRYFKKADTSYIFNVKIMQIIESLLGKDLLEKEFFKGNLYLALDKLYEYETKENIDLFFKYFGEIHKIYCNPDYHKHLDQIQSLIDRVYDILFSCLKNKIKKTKNILEKIQCFDKKSWIGKIKISKGKESFYINLLDKDRIDRLYYEVMNNYFDNFLEDTKKEINL